MIRTASKTVLRAGLWLALALSPIAWAQGEPAVTKRATELREQPGDAARSLAALPAQSPLTRLQERKGPWVQVRTQAGATGWVHLFDLGPASGSGSGSGSEQASSGGFSGALRGVTGLFSKSSPAAGTSVKTSTLGVRGLGAEDLANAQPNPAAVQRMEALRQSESQARDFAQAAALSAVAVDALPAPRSSGPAGWRSNNSHPGDQEAQ